MPASDSQALVVYQILRQCAMESLCARRIYRHGRVNRFRVELPPDIAAGIYDMKAECFDVDDVDEDIHDRDNITLVIL